MEYNVGDIVIIRRNKNADEEIVLIINDITGGFYRRFDFEEKVSVESINGSRDKVDINYIVRVANEKDEERFWLRRFSEY